LICVLYSFSPNPVVKPAGVASAGEVCEQSVTQSVPWVILHFEQVVFYTFQKIQSLEWGDYAGITSFSFKERKSL